MLFLIHILHDFSAFLLLSPSNVRMSEGTFCRVEVQLFQLKVHLKDMIAICDLISKSNLFVQHTRINNLDSCFRFGLLDNKIICRCPFELQTKIFVAQKETDYQTISFQAKPIKNFK